uniref:RRM domain-containing protein n=1 Tax=Globodera rostochiensis TaxID=31243 RepID=A0A914H409_GLORO
MSRRNETLDAKIYVGGLPEDATSEELDDVFHRFGRIRKIWVARRPPGMPYEHLMERGFAELRPALSFLMAVVEEVEGVVFEAEEVVMTTVMTVIAMTATVVIVQDLALLAVLEAALLHFVNAVDPRATVVVRAPALVEIRQSIDDNGIKEGNDHDRNLRFYFNLCYLFYLITSSYDFMHRTSKSIRLLTAGPVVRSAPIFVGIESGII